MSGLCRGRHHWRDSLAWEVYVEESGDSLNRRRMLRVVEEVALARYEFDMPTEYVELWIVSRAGGRSRRRRSFEGGMVLRVCLGVVMVVCLLWRLCGRLLIIVVLVLAYMMVVMVVHVRVVSAGCVVCSRWIGRGSKVLRRGRCCWRRTERHLGFD